MRAAAAIAGVELRRFLADRSNIFFAFIFPLLLVLVIGSQFGGDGTRGTVALAAVEPTAEATAEATPGETTADDGGSGGALVSRVADALAEAGLDVVRTAEPEAREMVARGRADAAVVVGPPLAPDDAPPTTAPDGATTTAPDGATTTASDDAAGAPARITLLPGTQPQATTASAAVRAALRSLAVEESVVATVAAASGTPPDVARDAVVAIDGRRTSPGLEAVDVDEVAQELSGLGRFELGAAGQLLLFTFLASLAGSETLIRARKDRVVARTLAAPVSTRQVVLGQALGRLAIAGFQGVYIMAATAVLFGVDWGDLTLALLVLTTFALVAAGGAMVIGSVMDNDGAAAGLGVGVSLVLAALGGAMFPLELFSDTLRSVANLTPHAWAYRAFAQIQRHDGGLVDVLPHLAVLAGFAAVLLLLGGWLLRRSLARAL